MGVASDAALVASLRRFISLAAPGIRSDSIAEALLTHPKYPNAAAILAALRSAGIEAAAVRAEPGDSPAVLTTPALLFLRSGELAVLEENRGPHVQWSHPRHGRQRADPATISREWNGIAIVIESIAPPQSPARTLGQLLRAPVAIVAAIMLLTATVIATSPASLTTIALLLLHIAGASVALIASDRESPLGSALCRAGSRFDCASVLDSAASSILGIPLIDLAACYFVAQGIALAFATIAQTAIVPLLAWLAIAALPVIAISLIAQAFVLRAWCAACLTIDAILFVQALLLWRARGPFDARAIALEALALCLAVIFVASRTLVPASTTALRRSHTRLKRNATVLAALLQRSQALPPPPSITPLLLLGDAAAPLVLTLVSSPYCSHCTEAHRLVEEIAQRGGLSVQFFFLVDPERQEDGMRAIVDAHTLLAQGESETAHAIVRRWFTTRRYDPSQASLDAQAQTAAKASLRAQAQWALNAGIDATPVILLNGRRLPAAYSVTDLAQIDLAELAALLPTMAR